MGFTGVCGVRNLLLGGQRAETQRLLVAMASPLVPSVTNGPKNMEDNIPKFSSFGYRRRNDRVGVPKQECIPDLGPFFFRFLAQVQQPPTSGRVWHSYFPVDAAMINGFRQGSQLAYMDMFLDTDDLRLAASHYWLRYRATKNVDGTFSESWALKLCSRSDLFVEYAESCGSEEAILDRLKQLSANNDITVQIPPLASSLHDVFQKVVTVYSAVRQTLHIDAYRTLSLDVVRLRLNDFYYLGCIEYRCDEIPEEDVDIPLPSKFLEALRCGKDAALHEEYCKLFPDFGTYITGEPYHRSTPPDFMVKAFSEMVD